MLTATALGLAYTGKSLDLISQTCADSEADFSDGHATKVVFR